MRKQGIIRSWNEARGFGVIRVGDETSLEKYFLHVSGIRSGTAIPKAGSCVEFEVSTREVSEGQLRQAIRADIDIVQASSDSSNGGAQ
jgi:cold shock CspA family protein